MKVIASHNGSKATQRAFELLQDGANPLDACVEGVSLVEDDPDDLTVGYGGLPNEDGIVELDAAVMDGASHRAGAVAGLCKIRHAAKVARLVLRQTKRVMLIGDGALRLAKANGFAEENLLTEKARRMWLYWLRTRSEHDDWQPPPAEEADLDVIAYFRDEFYSGGTVHCAAIDGNHDLAGATSTSGHAFKLAGRVGDSPILGAGLYVDNEAGTCGSIGHGEATMENVSSFLAVELMRQGASPVEAGLEAMRRIANKTPEHRCNDDGRPRFNVQLFLLSGDGTHAGVAMRGKKQFAITDQDGTRLEDCVALFN